MRQGGFSLTEVLIATAISSLLLISASRFLPGLQRAVLLQSAQRELEEEVWQRLFALGKQLQRAGYCAGNCQGQALTIGRQGRCIIARWDANSNGYWDSSASENDSTGFRLESGALETLRGATSCEGKAHGPGQACDSTLCGEESRTCRFCARAEYRTGREA